MAISLGRVGIWSPSHIWEDDAAHEAAAELDAAGYGALWLGTATPGLSLPEKLLAATNRLVVATGIVNVWTVDAAELAAGFHRLATAHPDRFLLGLGVSHAPIVERLGRSYTRPLEYLAGYLDALDNAAKPVPVDQRVLAALRPKALALAGQRSAGAHPYLVTPEHTRIARETLGAGPLLAPEQKVVLETDPSTARALARASVGYYLRLPNYVRSLLALGFTEDDVAGGGSDRLVDALVAWGTPERIAKRVAEHHDAGADHVAVQVLAPDIDLATRGGRPPRQAWQALAAALL
ncbi:LLM class F420-dependent oxidoreductase [Frankia sp. CiP1_Cm_nod2]|uniref:LLM class F420-dependent oxidoreductase n=1 Tax=Frankia sp. CiP1_Cm_nod2 TaxID=2897161 RepID=UPI002023F671